MRVEIERMYNQLRLQYNGKMQVFERTKTWLLAKNIYNLY